MPNLTHRRHALRLELLECREVLSWKAVPPEVIKVPAAPTEVTLNGQGDATGSAEVQAKEVDYYALTPQTAGFYTIAALTPASDLNTVLAVFNPKGKRLDFNNNIGSGNTDSRLVVSLKAGKRYYFGITNLKNKPAGSYDWSVAGPGGPGGDDRFEENDTLATAAKLGAIEHQLLLEDLALNDSIDYFRFDVAEHADVTVRLDFKDAQGNLDFYLWDSRGFSGYLGGSFENGRDWEELTLYDLAPGHFFVEVRGSDGASNPDYHLDIRIDSAVPELPDHDKGDYDVTLTFDGQLSAYAESLVEMAARRWEQMIVGDLPDVGGFINAFGNEIDYVDDIWIDVHVVSIDGPGGTLAAADHFGFVGMRSIETQGTDLPFAGRMLIDEADLATATPREFFETVLHEMAHSFGIGTEFWYGSAYREWLVVGWDTYDLQYVGAGAVAEYQAIFGVSAPSIPVENTTGNMGTDGAHWREAVLVNELMTGFSGPGPEYVSRITVAALGDLGYVINLDAADEYRHP